MHTVTKQLNGGGWDNGWGSAEKKGYSVIYCMVFMIRKGYRGWIIKLKRLWADKSYEDVGGLFLPSILSPILLPKTLHVLGHAGVNKRFKISVDKD